MGVGGRKKKKIKIDTLKIKIAEANSCELSNLNPTETRGGIDMARTLLRVSLPGKGKGAGESTGPGSPGG